METATPDARPNTQTKHCECCGAKFEAPVGRRGRPQVYHHPNCKKIMQLLSWLEDCIMDENFQPTKTRAGILRSALWNMGNQVNAK